MADPTKYVPGYSYSAWQANNPSKPLPAPEVDNDLAKIANSLGETIDALADIRRSDGALNNGTVHLEALADDTLDYIRALASADASAEAGEARDQAVAAAAEAGAARDEAVEAAAAARATVQWRMTTVSTAALVAERLICDTSIAALSVYLPSERDVGDDVTVYRTGVNTLKLLSGTAAFVGGSGELLVEDQMEVTVSWRSGLWQVKSRIQFLPNWLPTGATIYADFINDRYWGGGGRLADMSSAFSIAGLAFTRASVAPINDTTGRHTYVTSGTPRISYDPITLVRRGLWMEGAMTPLLTNTEAFDNAYWTKTTVTIDVNTDVAPDGATSAERYRPTSAAGNQIARASGITVVSGSRYTLSLFGKAGALSWLKLGFFYSTLRLGWFDIVNAVVGSVSGGGTLALRSDRAANGYVRAQMSHTMSTTTPQALFQSAASDGSSASGGDTVKYFSMWGAQLELGNFASSYNAGVARSADNLKRTVSTPAAISRSVGFTAAPGLPLTGQVIYQLDDGSEANRVRVVRDTAGAVRLIVTNASSETVNLSLGTADNTTFNRVAFTFNGTSFRASMNAAAVQIATASMPAVTNERYASGATAGDELYGHLSDFAQFDSLNDVALVENSRIFPNWVPVDLLNRPMLFFNDYVNERYWFNGTVYSTFSAFLSAIGGSGAPGNFSFPWTDTTFTVLYEGMTGNPTNDGRVHTLFQADNGTTSSYAALRHSPQSGSGGVNTEVRNSGTVQNGFGFNVIGRYAALRIATAFGTAPCILGATNSVNVTTGNVGTIPGLTTMRFGNSSSGAAANGGTPWKIGAWVNQLDASNITAIANKNAAWVEGDSYAAGSGDVGVGQNLVQTLRRVIANRGVGGTTLAAIETRVLAEVATYPGLPLILWDGDANGYDADIAVDQARYSNMISSLGHTKYVFIGPVPRAGLSAAALTRYKALCAWLKATLPAGQGVDPMDALITLMDQDTDGAAFTNRECPSRLTQDGVHLTKAAMDKVLDQLVIPVLTQWLTPE